MLNAPCHSFTVTMKTIVSFRSPCPHSPHSRPARTRWVGAAQAAYDCHIWRHHVLDRIVDRCTQNAFSATCCSSPNPSLPLSISLSSFSTFLHYEKTNNTRTDQASNQARPGQIGSGHLQLDLCGRRSVFSTVYSVFSVCLVVGGGDHKTHEQHSLRFA